MHTLALPKSVLCFKLGPKWPLAHNEVAHLINKKCVRVFCWGCHQMAITKMEFREQVVDRWTLNLNPSSILSLGVVYYGPRAPLPATHLVAFCSALKAGLALCPRYARPLKGCIACRAWCTKFVRKGPFHIPKWKGAIPKARIRYQKWPKKMPGAYVAH